MVVCLCIKFGNKHLHVGGLRTATTKDSQPDMRDSGGLYDNEKIYPLAFRNVQ